MQQQHVVVVLHSRFNRILKFKKPLHDERFFIDQIIIFHGQILKKIARVQVHSDKESNATHP